VCSCGRELGILWSSAGISSGSAVYKPAALFEDRSRAVGSASTAAGSGKLITAFCRGELEGLKVKYFSGKGGGVGRDHLRNRSFCKFRFKCYMYCHNTFSIVYN